MNLLGMKRRLLPYGMPLGGAGGAAAPSGGGKSSPAPSPRAPGFSNSLGFMSNALRGSVAQVQQPMQGGFGGMLGGGGAPSSGGKSSGLGQGGYGAAPGFQQPTAQNSPMQQSPFPPTPLHMMGDDFGRGNSGGMPMQGGKSLGGVSPYGGAPAFNDMYSMGMGGQNRGQSFDPRFSPAQMESRLRLQGSRLEGDNILDASGSRIGAIGGATPMQGGFGPQANPYQQSPFNPYQQPMQQPGFSGLQDLFNMMMGQNMGGFNRPMPQYQSPASMYRPDMQRAQQNLSRVRPSVQRQRQDEQAARIAELEAQLARFNSGE